VLDVTIYHVMIVAWFHIFSKPKFSTNFSRGGRPSRILVSEIKSVVIDKHFDTFTFGVTKKVEPEEDFNYSIPFNDRRWHTWPYDCLWITRWCWWTRDEATTARSACVGGDSMFFVWRVYFNSTHSECAYFRLPQTHGSTLMHEITHNY
jgi:hypothetical protein